MCKDTSMLETHIGAVIGGIPNWQYNNCKNTQHRNLFKVKTGFEKTD